MTTVSVDEKVAEDFPSLVSDEEMARALELTQASD